MFEREHYLGPVKRSGKGLLQVIEYQGQAVALLDWSPASLKLTDRDQWIGWNGRQRADRAIVSKAATTCCRAKTTDALKKDT